MRLYRSIFVTIIFPTITVAQIPSEPVVQPLQTSQKTDAQSPDELVEAGARLLDLQHFDEAIGAFTEALALDPKHGHAFANRALGYAHTNRLEEARRDLAEADRLISGHAVLHRIRGLIALRESDDATALAELSKSLEKEPGDPFALWHRARLYQDARNEPAAIADAEAHIRARPADADGYVLKADLLRAQQKSAAAAVEADRLLQLFPDDHYAIASAARVFNALGERERAFEAISKAIAIEPMSYYHAWRAGFRRPDDRAGRRTDLIAALDSDPGNAGIFANLGLLDFEEKRWPDAISRFSAVLAKEPKDFGVLAYRAMAHWSAGDRSAAMKDYQAALLAASGADDFNLICRSFATENMALDWAVEACDRAVSVKPRESRYLATRALVRLRLGQLEAALADYDAAITADDRRADAFFGRGLVRWRLGNKTSADADRIEAMARDPAVIERFRELGFTEF